MKKKLGIILLCFGLLAGCSSSQKSETEESTASVEEESTVDEEEEESQDYTREDVEDAANQESVVSDNTYKNDFGEFDEAATQIPVLMFHYFYDENTQTPENNNFYSIQKFEKQLAYWKENGYYTLSMEELYAWLQGEIEVPKKSLVITMDDGYAFTYDMAMPLLEKYDYLGISFEITSDGNDYATRNSYYNIETESHTHNMHQGTCPGAEPIQYGYIQCWPEEDAVADLETSAELLDGCIALAYPFGGYGGNAKRVAQLAGYKMAFTTQFGSVTRGMDPYELPRVRMSTDSWFEIY